LEREYEGQVRFLGVAWHDTEEAMQAFVDRYGIRMPTAIDETDQIFGRFGFFYQPAWVFLDHDGEMTALQQELGVDGLRAQIEDLIRS
jgi:hypothetical protein